MARHWILWLAAMLLVLPAAAEVYKVVDEQGRVTYTDSPPAEGEQHEPMDLPPINNQPATQVRPTAPRVADQESPARVDYQVRLLSPEDGTQVPPGQRNLDLTARVTPGLQEDAYIQFLLNGEPVAPPSTASSVTIEEIYRGAHQVSARVVNDQGRVLSTSDAVQVFVHRPSLNSPARRAP